MQSKPLVSAIMPTRNRREFIPAALACFMAQDWPSDRKQLVIADNSDEGQTVEDLVRGIEGVIYRRIDGEGRTTGAMRNAACEAATGDIVIHCDDDDYYAPSRITQQVEKLIESCAQMTGYRSIVFADDNTRRAWTYSGPMKRFAAGTSQCYWCSYWRESGGFKDLVRGEDSDFAQRCQRLASVNGTNMCVARVHPKSTTGLRRVLNGAVWTGARGEMYCEVPYSALADIGYPVL